MDQLIVHDNEKYISMAIQAVLHNRRKEMNLLHDDERSIPIIQDMSQEILKMAQSFKSITENSLVTAGKGFD